MIKSMTGFGSGNGENDDFKVHVEAKAVNQRFLETNFHMPYVLNQFELKMTKKIKQYISRGKLDININFQDLREKEVSIDVDFALAEGYAAVLKELREKLKLTPAITAHQIASYPDVVTVSEEDTNLDEAWPLLRDTLEQALNKMMIMRTTEGLNIKGDLVSRIKLLSRYADQLEALAPEIVAHYRQRLEKALSEFLSKEEIDENRLIQETAIYTDKVNYTEEIVRLRSHFDQFLQILESDEPIGRKLDFLVQEMNREVNTIASKACSGEGARIAVEAKTEIEKIREQIQNIE